MDVLRRASEKVFCLNKNDVENKILRDDGRRVVVTSIHFKASPKSIVFNHKHLCIAIFIEG